METSFDPPVLKETEPLLIPPLTENYCQRGILSAGQRLIWIGQASPRGDFIVDADEKELFRFSVLSICSDEEKIIGKAFQDWYAAAVRAAADSIKGYWTLDVLQFEMRDVPRTWNEFAALVRNHALKMNVNERRLIQFGTLYFVLHFRAAADFGKIDAKLNMEYCKPSAESLGRWVRKQDLWKKSTPESFLVLRDLTRCAPILTDDELSRECFKSLLVSPSGSGCLPCRKLFYFHAGTSRMIAFSGPDSV